MSLIKQSSLANRLLAYLPPADFALLQPHLRPVQLKVNTVLSSPDKRITHVYFPESGIGSVVAFRGDDRYVEVGLYGREGMSGCALLLDSTKAPHKHFMQIAGAGHRIKTDAFLRALQERRTLHQALLRFVHAFAIQTAQSALTNGAARIGERLARWLLMCDDRTDGSDIKLTHEFLSAMLSVRRPSVTNAIHVLEGKGIIRSKRGKIQIHDRAALKRLAGPFYGTPEAEYRRLIGPF